MPTTTKLQDAEPAGLELQAARAAPAVTPEHSASSADQPILSIRAIVGTADAEAFIEDALRDVRAYMEEHHATPAGAPFSICRPRGARLDVEAGWPTRQPLPGTGRIHAGALPRPRTAPQARAHPLDPCEPGG